MNIRSVRAATLAIAATAFATFAASADAVRDITDITYATVDGTALGLDLHVPAGVASPPLVVYVHGGLWSEGDKTQYPAFLVQRGFAVASLDFRSSRVARFPANVHDIKAGIRFLRAQASKYGYRADRIALAGASSGGHLAALVGTTGGNAELEGSEGEHRDQSSRVQAIVSWYGASNLTTILSQSTPEGLEVRAPALQRLFGMAQEKAPDKAPAVARLASPVFHVDAADPPLFLLHGDQDTQMPINQSIELEGAYRRAGAPVELMVLPGVGHVGGPFFQGEPVERVVAFLRSKLGT